LVDPHAQPDKAARVEAMFDAIAPTYEKVNALASLGQDAGWRRKAIAAADVRTSDIVLDLCCGTGDMIRTFAAHDPAPRLIIGADFSAQMLAGGRYDGIDTPIQLLRADALRLPFADQSVDVISCAFGVRNFQDLGAGLREMRRVLRADGRVVILEFAAPDNPVIRWGHRLYCETVLPRLGQWISRDRTGAYTYLPRSIRTFERRAEMVARLAEAGFSSVTTTSMNLGSVVIYRAER
jgi:demethylmenaquinone methyltransferase/2-methoxy-6-polyprenyl-1,4-benzoquinol methylase